MSKPITHTAHDDAPLSAARDPDATADAAAGIQTREGDSLIGRTVSINRPRSALYDAWRNFTLFPRFMENVQSVTRLDAKRSHWVVAAPGGQSVEWDSLIDEDRPGELISWHSEPGASVHHTGRVEFSEASSGRGTVVRLTLAYDPPLGAVGKVVAKLFQREPNIQARRELRRFKQLMETGEISTAQPPDAAPRA